MSIEELNELRDNSAKTVEEFEKMLSNECSRCENEHDDAYNNLAKIEEYSKEYFRSKIPETNKKRSNHHHQK
jgi:flagellar biosynthesis chaperone FliJ